MKTLTITRNASRLVDKNLRVPSVGKFHRIIHDAELYGFPRQKETTYPNRSIPATRPLWGATSLPTSDFYPMLQSWQFRLYELFRLAVGSIPEDGWVEYWWYENPDKHGERIVCKQGTPNSFPQFHEGTLRAAYMSFIEDHRAFTDRHSFNTPERWYKDFVINLNPQSTSPWMFKSLATTGNIVRELDPQPQGVNSKYLAIETLDLTKSAPSLEWILQNKPYLILWATEQGGMDKELPRTPDGKRRWTVARFPQLKVVCRKYGIEEVGTPYFAPGNGYNLIEKIHLAPAESGALYTPYV